MPPSSLFTDKYSPKNFEEFIGNVEIVDFAKAWAEGWQKGVKQKPLLFFGQSGSGKTCLAYLIAKQFGWQIFEMNASDLRDKESIEKIAGAATGNASLFGGKRLVLLDEIDGLQSQDRGGSSAIAAIIKESSNPIILTANEIYGDKKMLPLRALCELKEFKKINYLSIAKRLREIASIDGITFEDEAIKELAKNSGGDFRSALSDLQSLAPHISMQEVQGLFPRERKEKVFSVLTKVFKGKTIQEVRDSVDSSEVDLELLSRWIEENIPRQYDAQDAPRAFESLSRADIFNGRIFNRQHFGFFKYSLFLSTVGVCFSREKDYHSWTPFQFPSLLTDLSASSGKRETVKGISAKIGEKTHCSKRQGVKDLPYFKTFMEDEKLAESMALFFDFEEKELAFLLGKKVGDKKVEDLLKRTEGLEKKMIIEKAHGKQATLFG